MSGHRDRLWEEWQALMKRIDRAPFSGDEYVELLADITQDIAESVQAFADSSAGENR